jgi:glycosyltransferase involved in cell wall biosynthesis
MTQGGQPRGLRLALVSAYPPSIGPLSEYSWHLVESLRRSERVAELHVLADRAPGAVAFDDGHLRVRPTWTFDGFDLPVETLRAIRALKVDAVWFQMHLTSTGNRRVSRFVGLTAPVLARLAGARTLVTLHNMIGATDLDQTAVRTGPVDLVGALAATSLVCQADIICVPRPEYAMLLSDRYGSGRVRYVPLGTPGVPLTAPVSTPRRGIVAFGHFGSNKRLETVIASVLDLAARRRDVHLAIGGTSSRHNPRYLQELRARHSLNPAISFLDYVPEPDVPALFQAAAVSVLPYATTTGMSSVALQSAMYGAQIVASDVPGLRALEREGLRMHFYDWGSAPSLAAAIEAALDAPDAVRRSHQRANMDYCHRQRMDLVADRYLDLFDHLAGVSSRRPRVRRA